MGRGKEKFAGRDFGLRNGNNGKSATEGAEGTENNR